MSPKAILQLALLFAPLALLSACGPAYSDPAASSGQNATNYAYNNQGWDNIPAPDNGGAAPTGAGSGSGSGNGSGPTGSGTLPGSAASTVVNFCRIHDCVATFTPNIKLVQVWTKPIPVPAPDPAPMVNSVVIYSKVAYKVVGYASTGKPAILVTPIATLQSH